MLDLELSTLPFTHTHTHTHTPQKTLHKSSSHKKPFSKEMSLCLMPFVSNAPFHDNFNISERWKIFTKLFFYLQNTVWTKESMKTSMQFACKDFRNTAIMEWNSNFLDHAKPFGHHWTGCCQIVPEGAVSVKLRAWEGASMVQQPMPTIPAQSKPQKTTKNTMHLWIIFI